MTVVGAVVSDDTLETNAWVIAARRADLAITEAINAADFTIEPLQDHVEPHVTRVTYDSMFARYIRRGRGWPTYPGPAPQVPLSVEHLSENGLPRTRVTFCAATAYWTPDDADEGDLTAGKVRTLTMSGDTGATALLVASSTALDGTCDATHAPVGTFRPAPVERGVLATEDVVPAADPSAHQ